jgi:uncharacterized membrane protein
MPMSGGGNQPAEAGAAITYGWNKFKENWGEIIVALIVGFVILAVMGLIGFLIQRSLVSVDDCTVRITDTGVVRSSGCGDSVGFFTQLFAAALFQFLVLLGQSVMALFVIRATLMIVRGERLQASKIMTADNLVPYMIGAVIVSLMTFVGIILCVLPGIAVWFFTLFWGYFVVDKDMPPIEAITASFNMVKDNIGPVILFVLLSWVVMFVGAILCGIGLIVAIPVVIIATGYMYKRLLNEPVAA